MYTELRELLDRELDVTHFRDDTSPGSRERVEREAVPLRPCLTDARARRGAQLKLVALQEAGHR